MTEPSLFPEEKGEEFRFDRNYYEECVFEKTSATDLRINDIEFYNCTFNSVVFINSSFNSCRFEKCSFRNSDLSVSRFTNSSFIDVIFENCKIIGIDWTKICMPVKMDFKRCKLNDSIFTGMDLRSMEIVSCEARNLDFEKTNLSKIKMTDTDLLNTTFANTNLSFADMTGSLNYRIDPARNNIRKAKFSLPDVLALLDQWDIEII